MILLLIITFLLLLFFHNFYYKRKNLPSGPIPLPFVGTLPQLFLFGPPEELFLKWRDKFGPVFTHWMGEDPIVAVTDFETIRDAFQKDGDAYVDRPAFDEFNEITRGGNFGIIDIDGDLWREHRRFALHILRDFGLGTNLMQDRILDEVNELLDILKKKVERCEQNPEYEFDISEPIDVSVGSIINSVLFGYRFSGDKLQEFYELKSLLRRFFEAFSSPLILASINHPKFFRKLPFFKSAINNTLYCNDSLFEFFERQINEHIGNIDFETESAPTDFIEAFLREAKRRDKDGLEHTFSTMQLKSVCSDLGIAGQETTSTTLIWGIYFLMSHPTVQARLHSELDAVIGSDRMVTISDKSKLPFTNAVVAEVQRAANLLPLNLLRRTTREVKIDGQVIPKGTNISPMISCVLYDPKIFPNPKAFDPGRFIDENGTFRKCDEIIPFSIGKRQCLGEGLARMELFLFIANIFNMCKIIPSPISGLPSADRKYQMITAQPPKFKCRIKARHR